ncbi:cytochrome c oxidase subunit VB-domain-containing protein [Amanita rubescens]|nr:cytochrome c oxidase subunit VB-domain-containing protein [Amanita rubescens]
MLQSALRAARPLVARSSRVNAIRAFSTTPRAASDGPPPPQLIGPGGKPGEVPSDYDQLTGLARLQLLGDMQGIKIFDDGPLDSSRIGTKANPVLVQSYDVERIIGCTGSPADSHDILWFNLTTDKLERCTECGSVYKLDYHGEEHGDAHHH